MLIGALQSVFEEGGSAPEEGGSLRPDLKAFEQIAPEDGIRRVTLWAGMIGEGRRAFFDVFLVNHSDFYNLHIIATLRATDTLRPLASGDSVITRAGFYYPPDRRRGLFGLRGERLRGSAANQPGVQGGIPFASFRYAANNPEGYGLLATPEARHLGAPQAMLDVSEKIAARLGARWRYDPSWPNQRNLAA